MPGDNATPVAPGAAVSFPSTAAATAGIDRQSETAFTLTEAGTYLVLFQVSVTEAGQLQLALNDVAQPQTVVGRSTRTSQIVGMSIITAPAGGVLTVINPAGSTEDLTITPTAGGTESVSAHLVILRLA